MMTGDASVNSRRQDHLLHGRDPGQYRPPRRRRRRRGLRGDGRVPLLRRPRPGLGVAGAHARAAPGAVPADVGHAGRRHPLPDRPDPAYGAAHRRGQLGRAPGAAALRVRHHDPAGDHRGAPRHPPGADLRGARQPGGGHRAGPDAEQPAGLHPGGEGPDRRTDRQLPVQRRLRQDPVPAGAQRDRGASRGPAAEVPPPGRAAGPGRAAQDHLRHRHPGRGHQRPHPYGAAHLAQQVRRDPAPAADCPGVPSDRRPGRAGRLRRGRHGDGAGAGPRRGQPEGLGEGRRRPEEAPQGGPQEAAGGHDRLRRTDVRAVDPRRARTAAVLVPGQPLHAAERDQPVRRLLRRDAAPAHRERRAAGAAADPHPPGAGRSTAGCSAPRWSSSCPNPTRWVGPPG